jgi:hypothetical protein
MPPTPANYANVQPAAFTGGTPYATNVPLTGAEVDLGVPFSTNFSTCISAIAELTISGSPASQTTYIVMQTDFGDSVWLDMAWITITTTPNGQYNFYLSAGFSGNNAWQQLRVNGSAPNANGSNVGPLGARVRFVGRTQLSGGNNPQVVATVRYQLQPLR